MKKMFTAIVLAACTMAASAMPVTSGAGVTIDVDPLTVEAGTFTLLGWEHAGTPSMTLEVQSPGGGTMSAGVSGISATFVSSFDGFVESFIAYCIEIFTRSSPFGVGVGMERFAAVAPQVSQLFAFSDSLNTPFSGLGFGAAATTDNAVRSAGLQLALWELIYDDTPGSLTSGKFSVAGGGATGSAAVAWGNSLLTNYSTFAGTTSLTVFTDVNVGNKLYQDFITATPVTGLGCPAGVCEVPAPGTLALAGLGLLGAGLIGNRRRKITA
jgi:hypothetical protein